MANDMQDKVASPKENEPTTQDAEKKEEAPKEATEQKEQPKSEIKIEQDTTVRNQAIKDEIVNGEALFSPNNLGLLNEVSISLTIEIGRAQIKIRDLLNLTKGSIIELNKSAGDPVDIYANGKLIATGSIIMANGKYCVRVTSIPEKSKLGAEGDGN